MAPKSGLRMRPLLDELETGKEVADFEGRRIRSVGAVRAVTCNAGPQIVPDGTWGGFLGIGRAHGVAPFRDGTFRLENHSENLAGTHEVRELSEKWALPMNGVESPGLFLGQLHRLDGYDRESGFMNPSQNFSLLAAADRIGLDDCECSFK